MARKAIEKWDDPRDGAMLIAPLDGDAFALHVGDNSKYPPSPTNLNMAEVWSWRESTLAIPNYDGPPDKLLRIALGSGGRGHSLTVLSATQAILSTSERHTDPNNGGEGWVLVPLDASGDLTLEQCPHIRCDQLFAGTPFEQYGARHAIQLGDGTILLGSWAMWRQVPLEAFHWSAEERADAFPELPMWTVSGSTNVGQFTGSYDWAVIPGTRKVEINGDDKVYQFDFSVAPGTNLSTTAKIMQGDNVGGPFNENWIGSMALDAGLNLWKIVGRLEHLHWWSAATLASRPSSGSFNPAPDKILRIPTIEALDGNVTGIGTTIDIDSAGNLYLGTNRWDPVNDPVRSFFVRVPAAAVEAGGVQEHDRLVYMPANESGESMRLAPQFRLHAR